MFVYSFASPPVLIAHVGLHMQEGYGLYYILHHLLRTFGCLDNCMDCRLASTVLDERRADHPAVRTPEVLQLSEKGKNSDTNTTLPAWHFCAQLLEGQLCLSSTVGIRKLAKKY